MTSVVQDTTSVTESNTVHVEQEKIFLEKEDDVDALKKEIERLKKEIKGMKETANMMETVEMKELKCIKNYYLYHDMGKFSINAIREALDSVKKEDAYWERFIGIILRNQIKMWESDGDDDEALQKNAKTPSTTPSRPVKEKKDDVDDVKPAEELSKKVTEEKGKDTHTNAKKGKTFGVSYSIVGSGYVEIDADDEEDASYQFDFFNFGELMEATHFKNGVELDDIEEISDNEAEQ